MMCIRVRVNGVLCETVSQLAAAVGGYDELAAEHFSDSIMSPDSCLCGIDVRTTAENAAMTAVGPDEFGDWLLTELEASR
jgi:hypothetical protein